MLDDEILKILIDFVSSILKEGPTYSIRSNDYFFH